MTSSVRVRFAPSPTGHLHLGSARSAIFNWLYARHTGGTFLLRIEDTDTLRSKPEYLESQMKSFAWLGITPDEPIVYQLQRAPLHRQIAHELVERGLAYKCYCEISAEKYDQAAEGDFTTIGKYPGTCRNRQPQPGDDQKEYAIRFRIPAGSAEVSYDDLVHGTISFSLDQFEDFIIIRRDGVPTYNFAVVVDDRDMAITHVIRGDDHIANTPKQIFIYHALGATPPQFAHIPLILGPSGERLSKRDGAVNVIDYKTKGILAPALFNYLVRLGWSHGDQEIFTSQDLIEKFDIKDVNSKNAQFDLAKLDWLNAVYVKQMSLDELLDYIQDYNPEGLKELVSLWGIERTRALIALYRDRHPRITAITDEIIALATKPTWQDIYSVKPLISPMVINAYQDACMVVQNAPELSVQQLNDQIKALVTTHGIKFPQLAQILRYALTGFSQGVSVFELMVALGGVETLERLLNFRIKLNQ